MVSVSVGWVIHQKLAILLPQSPSYGRQSLTIYRCPLACGIQSGWHSWGAHTAVILLYVLVLASIQENTGPLYSRFCGVRFA